ncbi:MAG: single-stranded-DNA-specific exonuclease RecJ [Lachnospiraceae bacterium]|nr:single-stranded-DNA-specific exonuclease RecJ [Lachnospiraceae bacterium]
MAKWMLVRKGGDAKEIAEKYNIDPLLVRVLMNRGISGDVAVDGYLNGDYHWFHRPEEMKDMEKACVVLTEKIAAKSPIRIIGDYDIDGVCATAILCKGLRGLGGNVDTQIPHRIKDGYGMNINMIEKAAAEGINTILTCDNGIAAKDAVVRAKELGLSVIITDHHEVPFTEEGGVRKFLLPPADAVVDPKREDCNYPFPHICGAFVAYKLVELLYKTMEKEALWQEHIDEMIQIAAFATVGDIMELKDENRILVQEGLKRMRTTRCVGLKALLSVLGLQNAEITAFHLGFLLGPCLNATGRIDSADRALDLLLAEKESDAMQLAGDLKAMNDSRKMITEQGTAEAISRIESGAFAEDKVLVVYLPDCHESVAGIIAGRLREKYGKPAFVVTKGEEGLKGSGRSIEAYHMYEEMNKIAEVFTKFGGHAQAAGFSLREENLDKMRKMLNENCRLTPENMQEILHIDAAVPLSYISPKLVNDLKLLEPCGNGNERPVFAVKNLLLKSGKLLGAEGKVGKYRVTEEAGSSFELTLFQKNGEFRRFLEEKYGTETAAKLYGRGCEGVPVSVAYYPQWNEFQGKKSLQYVMVDYC